MSCTDGVEPDMQETGRQGRWALQAQKERQVIQVGTLGKAGEERWVDKIRRAGWQGKLKARQAMQGRQTNSDPELHGTSSLPHIHWPDSKSKLIHTLCLHIFQINDRQHHTQFPITNNTQPNVTHTLTTAFCG
jgi:hypothetical protein